MKRFLQSIGISNLVYKLVNHSFQAHPLEIGATRLERIEPDLDELITLNVLLVNQAAHHSTVGYLAVEHL